MNVALKIYRWLAQAFPHEFKLLYGREMLQLGEDVVEEIARRHGIAGLIHLIADIAIRLPVEYLSEMRQDMHYAARGLIKSPGFALVGIISMGLGIGLTTTIYTSKWQLISRELPAAANAQRLVMPEKPVSYYYIEQYRDQKNLFTGVAAFQTGVAFNVNFQNDENSRPQRVFGQIVSPDYFSVLGVDAQIGRMLSADIDKPGDPAVVVITDRFWRNRLNSLPGVVGQTLRVNGQQATIIGVAPKDFNGAISINPSELFIPTTAPAAIAPELANDVLHQRNAREFLAMACLAPGVTMESAEAALDTITRQLNEQELPAEMRVDKGKQITLLSAGTRVPLPRDLKPVLLGFFVVLMGLIMIIACMNLANMLLARGVNRQKELAIRLSVGASRFRLVRQMVTEGILLSLLGGIAGFVLAFALTVLRSKFTPPLGVPVESDFTPDWRAAIFVFAISILCGFGFSLAPALRATKADLTPLLKGGSALHIPGYRRLGLRNLLMVAQVTGSVMLLLITGFLVLGISQTNNVQTRFDPHTMYLLSIDPVRQGYSPERAQALFEKLPERLKTIAAVRSVAMATQAPFTPEDEDAAVQVTAENSRVQISAIEETVGAEFFTAISEPMLAGHEFSGIDQRTSSDGSKPLPVVLNESAARGFFGSGNAIGERIRDDGQPYEVVGVVHDLRSGLRVGHAIIYLPLTRRNFARPPASGITIMVRSEAGTDVLDSVRRELASIDLTLNIFNMRSLNEYLELSRASDRIAVNTYGGIGLFGLVLAAIGLAGVTAYAVAQRRKEIGIRMALGASKGQVLALVLREGIALVSAGTILGFLGAFALAKMLSALTSVFVDSLAVGTNDPRLLVGAPLLLAMVAMLACYIPARRSTRLDPLKALREE